MATVPRHATPLPDGDESFRDGLGVRVLVTDEASGDTVERLYLSTDLARLGFAVDERTSRLVNFRHARFARLRGVDAEPDGGPVWVCAEAVPGVRLFHVLQAAEQGRVTIDVNTALQIAREILPALATLHDSRNVTHGALGPERLVLTPQARLTIVDLGLGAALGQLQYPRTRLWREFRIAVPPAAGVPRFDARADVAMVAMTVLAALLGRPITLNEFPDHIRELLDRARERPASGRERHLSASLRAWLERTLPIESRRPLSSALEAQVALEEAIKKERSYAPGASALKHFVERLGPLMNELAAPARPVVETPDSGRVAPASKSSATVIRLPGSGSKRAPRRPTPEEEQAEEIAFLEQELARLAAEEAGQATPAAGAGEGSAATAAVTPTGPAVPVAGAIEEPPATGSPAAAAEADAPVEPDDEAVALARLLDDLAEAAPAVAPEPASQGPAPATLPPAEPLAAAVAPPVPDERERLSRAEIPTDDGEAVVEILGEVPLRLPDSPVIEFSEFGAPGTGDEEIGLPPALEFADLVIDDPSALARVGDVTTPGAWQPPPVEALPEVDLPRGDHAVGIAAAPAPAEATVEPAGEVWCLAPPPWHVDATAGEALGVGTVAPNDRDTLWFDFELMHASRLLPPSCEPATGAGVPAPRARSRARLPRVTSVTRRTPLARTVAPLATPAPEADAPRPRRKDRRRPAQLPAAVDAPAAPMARRQVRGRLAEVTGQSAPLHLADVDPASATGLPARPVAPQLVAASDVGAVALAPPTKRPRRTKGHALRLVTLPADVEGVAPARGAAALAALPARVSDEEAPLAPRPAAGALARLAGRADVLRLVPPAPPSTTPARLALPAAAAADAPTALVPIEAGVCLSSDTPTLAAEPAIVGEITPPAPVEALPVVVEEDAVDLAVEEAVAEPALADHLGFAEAIAEPAPVEVLPVVVEKDAAELAVVEAVAEPALADHLGFAEATAEPAPVEVLPVVVEKDAAELAAVEAVAEPAVADHLEIVELIAEPAPVEAQPVVVDEDAADLAIVEAVAEPALADHLEIVEAIAEPVLVDVALEVVEPVDRTMGPDAGEPSLSIPELDAALAELTRAMVPEVAEPDSTVVPFEEGAQSPLVEAGGDCVPGDEAVDPVSDEAPAEADGPAGPKALAQDAGVAAAAAAAVEPSPEVAPGQPSAQAEPRFVPGEGLVLEVAALDVSSLRVVPVPEPLPEEIRRAELAEDLVLLAALVELPPAAEAPDVEAPDLVEPVELGTEAAADAAEGPVAAAAELTPLATHDDLPAADAPRPEETPSDPLESAGDATPAASEVQPAPAPDADEELAALLSELKAIEDAEEAASDRVQAAQAAHEMAGEPALRLQPTPPEPAAAPAPVEAEVVAPEATVAAPAAAPDRAAEPALAEDVVVDVPAPARQDRRADAAPGAPKPPVEGGAKRRRSAGRGRRRLASRPPAVSPTTLAAPQAPGSAPATVAAAAEAPSPVALTDNSPLAERRALTSSRESWSTVARRADHDPARALHAPVAPTVAAPEVAVRREQALLADSPSFEATLPAYAPWLAGEPLPAGAAEASPLAAAPAIPAETDRASVYSPEPAAPPAPIAPAPVAAAIRPVVAATDVPLTARPLTAVASARDANAGSPVARSRPTAIVPDPQPEPPVGFLSAPVAAPQTRRPVWLVLAAVLAVVIVGGLGAYLLLRPARTGTLTVEASVLGLEVVIDGHTRGTTPVTVELPAGRHAVEIRGHGSSRSLAVEVTAGRQTKQQVNWSEGRSTGSLKVTSTPEGAKVLIGGELRGVTPVVIEGLTAGQHLVSVEGEAGTVRRQAKVTAGVVSELDVSIFSGWLQVFAPFKMEVREDGRRLGTSEDGKLLLPPGTHQLELVNTTYGVEEKRRVEITPGGTETLSISAPTGSIDVTAPPGTQIFVDGELKGTTPLAEPLRVTVGTHNVVLSNADSGQIRPQQVVTVKARQATPVRF